MRYILQSSMAMRSALSLLFLASLVKAQDLTLSPGVVCRRWSHASALYDGVIYMYGGQVWTNASDAGKINNTVTRDFITLDLTNDFPVSKPAFGGLVVPPVDGPPAVANATFWVDDNEAALYFYGGSYENYPPNPNVAPLTLWAYHPKTSLWSNVSTGGDHLVRATRGASAVYNGIGYYRGGQLSQYTVPNWGSATGNTYLGGMFEYDFSNSSYRNITQGFDVYGQSIQAGYVDGNLIPVVLKGGSYLVDVAGGGRTGTALPLTNAYIYDIEKQTWYQQPINGQAPTNTRGACTVTNYAPDNSSVNVVFYGGKVWDGDANIFVPSDNMWVLTIPSFTWISVPLDGAVGSPGARQDHACHIMGSNMLVVGGRNTSNVCDNSTVYVFDTSDLTWQTSYIANKTGYTVPSKIYNIIGGSANGSAPWTNAPAIAPSDPTSPLATLNRSTTGGSKSHAGAIAGGVVGGVCVLIGIAATIYLLQKNKKKKEQPILPPGDEEYYQPPMSQTAEKGTWQSNIPIPSPPLSGAPPYSSIHGVSSHVGSPLSQLDAGDYQFPVEIGHSQAATPASYTHNYTSPVVELPGEPVRDTK